jgi:preprotein translocase subunit SecB
MSNPGFGPNGDSGGGAEAPQLRIQIVGQYVKDLSFENPGAPMNAAVAWTCRRVVSIPSTSKWN